MVLRDMERGVYERTMVTALPTESTEDGTGTSGNYNEIHILKPVYFPRTMLNSFSTDLSFTTSNALRM